MLQMHDNHNYNFFLNFYNESLLSQYNNNNKTFECLMYVFYFIYNSCIYLNCVCLCF